MDRIIFEPVGTIVTAYKTRLGTPTQGKNSADSRGVIVMEDKFVEGTRDFRIGQKIEVVFVFHKSKSYKLVIKPHGSNIPKGVFSTRSPDRPNSIGITVVEITKVDGNRIEFIGADMLDGSPVIDLKPFI